jgi:hypothetical protein
LLHQIDEELDGGRQVHRCHLVFEHRSEPLVGSKRAAVDTSDGSVRVMCDVCNTTHTLWEGSQIYDNFMRGHLLKLKHEEAARRAAAARDVEELPEAAPPEALAARSGLPTWRAYLAPAGLRQRQTEHGSAAPGHAAAVGDAAGRERTSRRRRRAEQLGVRDDFAIAFLITDARGERYEWWLGRVLALFRKSAGKSFTQVNSVSLSEPLYDVMVVASWYEPTDASRAVYRLGSVNDTRKYPLGGSYLGCPRLDYDEEARVCRLVDAPRQIRVLDDSLAATKPVREGSTRTVSEARALDARRREQQRAQWTASGAAPAAPRDRAASAAQREAARAEQLRSCGRGAHGGRGGRWARYTRDALKKQSVSG